MREAPTIIRFSGFLAFGRSTLFAIPCIILIPRESGGIGRRAGFRCQWGNP